MRLFKTDKPGDHALFVLIEQHEDSHWCTVMNPKTGGVRLAVDIWVRYFYHPSDDYKAAYKYINN